MKRRKNLALMVVFLAFLIGATFLTRKISVEDITDQEESDRTLLYMMEEDALRALTWDYNGETLTLCKEKDGWFYEKDTDFPLSEAKAEKLVDAISTVTAEMTIEKPENLTSYGLDDPQQTIIVKAQEQTVFQLGKGKSMDGFSYLSVGDGKVYLVDKALADAFTCGLYDLVQAEAIPSMDDLEKMIVTSEVQSYEIDHMTDSGITYTDSYEWFLKDGDGYLTLDNSLASGFANKIRNLIWQECVDYKADEQALASYGLDQPTVTAEMHYRQSTQVETSLTADDGMPVYETVEEEKVFCIEIGNYTGNACYAHIAGSSMVYLVNASLSDELMYMDYQNLRPDEVICLPLSDLTDVEVIVDGQTKSFHKVSRTVSDEENETTMETVYLFEGEKAEIENLLYMLNGLTATGFADKTEPKRTAELAFLFTQNQNDHSNFELVFYPYDSTSCLVTIDGESTVFVSRYDVEKIKEYLEENGYC